MTRRTLLASLAGAFAGGYAAGEVEELLWTPGKKLISIPAPAIRAPSTEDMIDRYNRPAAIALAENIERDMVYYSWVYGSCA